jgi:hypothetical protein
MAKALTKRETAAWKNLYSQKVVDVPPPRKKAKSKEHDLQVECVNWFRKTYNDLIFAIPNGGARNVITGAKLKAEGVLAGVPDLFVAKSNQFYAGLFIEMKAEKGSVSDVQKAVIQQLRDANYCVAVCKSLIDFQEIIRNYFSQ